MLQHLHFHTNDLDYFLKYVSVLRKFKRTQFQHRIKIYQKLKTKITEEQLRKKLGLDKALDNGNWGAEEDNFEAYYDVSVWGNKSLLRVYHDSMKLNYTLYTVKERPDFAQKLANAFIDLAWVDPPGNKVEVSFAQWGSGSVDTHTDLLKCPKWEEIKDNYVNSDKLERLLKEKEPWKLGKIIILHGAPGGGKTYFIRALMQAWKDSFKLHVIGDPEEFARNPSYYFELASSNSDNDWETDEYGRDVKKKTGHSLFIIEDAADLILTESRQAHYDKIGKLLNITDGLLGQGREDLILVTFNEDINDIDPAFLRPGRCAADLEISKFDTEQANAWLKSKGSTSTVTNPSTLAELYNVLLRGDTSKSVPASKSQFGFGGKNSQ